MASPLHMLAGLVLLLASFINWYQGRDIRALQDRVAILEATRPNTQTQERP